jgi:hypothetical protein
MLRPQLRDQKIGQDFVGLGWFCAGKDEQFWFGHQGGNEGFLAEIRMFPALGQGAVVMVNSIQGWSLRGELTEAIGREYQWPRSQNNPTASPMITGVGYAGLYRSDDATTVQVTQETERLLLHFGQQRPLPLFPIAGGEFFATAIYLRARFDGSDTARPAGLTITLSAKTISLNRVDTSGDVGVGPRSSKRSLD